MQTVNSSRDEKFDRYVMMYKNINIWIVILCYSVYRNSLKNIHELSCLCIWDKICIHPICMFATIILCCTKTNTEHKMYINVETITGFCLHKNFAQIIRVSNTGGLGGMHNCYLKTICSLVSSDMVCVDLPDLCQPTQWHGIHLWGDNTRQMLLFKVLQWPWK